MFWVEKALQHIVLGTNRNIRKNIFTSTVSARSRLSSHVMIYHRFQTEYILNSEWGSYWFYNSVYFFFILLTKFLPEGVFLFQHIVSCLLTNFIKIVLKRSHFSIFSIIF